MNVVEPSFDRPAHAVYDAHSRRCTSHSMRRADPAKGSARKCDRYGEMEDGPLLRADHKTPPKWSPVVWGVNWVLKS